MFEHIPEQGSGSVGRSRGGKIVRGVFFTLVISVFSVSLWIFSVVRGVEYSRGSERTDIVFTVEEGQDIRVLARRLHVAGIIGNEWSFLLHAYRDERWKRVLAGDYLINGSLSIPELFVIFQDGDTGNHGVRVTFPEGWTAAEMAARLGASGFSEAAFLEIVENPGNDLLSDYPFLANLPADASLEGFLFPDTYFFDPEGGPDGIVRKMLDGFESKAWPTLSASGKRYDDLVLASILETEVRTSGDRRLVADLFLRRLDAGMPLQSDATVRYALGETKVKHSLEDLEIDSPYNSYKYPGLPPGPVSNPGVDAIEAALYPTPNPYWYFLNNPETGETVFSVTFDEHVANKGRNGL